MACTGGSHAAAEKLGWRTQRRARGELLDATAAAEAFTQYLCSLPRGPAQRRMPSHKQLMAEGRLDLRYALQVRTFAQAGQCSRVLGSCIQRMFLSLHSLFYLATSCAEATLHAALALLYTQGPSPGPGDCEVSCCVLRNLCSAGAWRQGDCRAATPACASAGQASCGSKGGACHS